MANGLRVSAEEEPYPFTRRMSYVHHRAARKMSEDLSIAVIPSFVTEFCGIQRERTTCFWWALESRYKLGPRFSLNGEYHHFLTPTFGDAFSPSLSLGVDIEMGGHVFQLHITNACGMFECSFLAEPLGTWRDGKVYFGFNLSRVFTVKS